MTQTLQKRFQGGIDRRARLGLGRTIDDARATFLLAHGRAFTPDSRTYAGRRMRKQQCFANAQRIVWRELGVSEPTFVYVEGYAATSHVEEGDATCSTAYIEHLHGWLMRRDGSMVDPTWRPKPAEPPRLYFGVPFSFGYVLRVVEARGWQYGCLLDDFDLLEGRVTDFAP
jgi:hypothetical protein